MLKQTDFLDLSYADRARRVADFIEQYDAFAMETWSHCIAGCTLRSAGLKQPGIPATNKCAALAGALLGLYSLEERLIMFSYGINGNLRREEAAAKLRRYADAIR